MFKLICIDGKQVYSKQHTRRSKSLKLTRRRYTWTSDRGVLQQKTRHTKNYEKHRFAQKWTMHQWGTWLLPGWVHTGCVHTGTQRQLLHRWRTGCYTGESHTHIYSTTHTYTHTLDHTHTHTHTCTCTLTRTPAHAHAHAHTHKHTHARTHTHTHTHTQVHADNCFPGLWQLNAPQMAQVTATKVAQLLTARADICSLQGLATCRASHQGQSDSAPCYLLG